MKKLLITLFLGVSTLAYSQTIDNILDLTTVQTHGTARYTAMGGSFTALGNDISGLHYNPAGIGVFRRDHFNLSLGIMGKTSTSDYFGERRVDSRGNLLFENIGYVKTFKGNSKSSFAIGISYAKKADFYREFEGGSQNAVGQSLASVWLDNSIGFTPDQLLNDGFLPEVLAYRSFIIDTNANTGLIERGNFTQDGSQTQNYVVSKSGSLNDFALTFGGKYDRYFQWGVSLNVPYMRTTTITTFTEGGFASNSDLREHFLTTEENFTATGINGNFGVIFTPFQWFRLGASYQTPTRYSFFSTYDLNSESSFNNGDEIVPIPILTESNGIIVTPSILRGGLGIVLGKHGLVSASYERNSVQNSTARYGGFEDSFENSLRAQETFRLGGEVRFGQYSVRGGYANTSNPFNEQSQFFENRNSVTGGLGIRGKNYAISFAYVQTITDRNIPAYSSAQSNIGIFDEQISQGNFVFDLSLML